MTATNDPTPTVEQVGRLRMFLEVLSAMGGRSDASDYPWSWINAFCGEHEGEGLDTFNRAINLGYTTSSHNTDTDEGMVYLTDAGRAFLATTPTTADYAAGQREGAAGIALAAYTQGYKDGCEDSDAEPDMESARDGWHDWLHDCEALKEDDDSAHPVKSDGVSFQQRVHPWLMACFGEMIAGDREERNHRFLEEALELVQSTGCTASEARQLVDYVYGRPIGDPAQEVGGVMVTLAALCLANSLDMHVAAEIELSRIWTKVEAIRAKQAAKPKHSPLPQAGASAMGDRS